MACRGNSRVIARECHSGCNTRRRSTPAPGPSDRHSALQINDESDDGERQRARGTRAALRAAARRVCGRHIRSHRVSRRALYERLTVPAATEPVTKSEEPGRKLDAAPLITDRAKERWLGRFE